MSDIAGSAGGLDYRGYLTEVEAQEIRDQFAKVSNHADRLVFWTGIPRAWAEAWAGEREMLTLSSMMGPLMDPKSPRCPRVRKSLKAWSKYVKGASVLFAEDACNAGTITMLMASPYNRCEARARSTYRSIEKPILQGVHGNLAVDRILCVHPAVVGAENVPYEIWPLDRSLSWQKMYGPDCKSRKPLRRERGPASQPVRVASSGNPLLLEAVPVQVPSKPSDPDVRRPMPGLRGLSTASVGTVANQPASVEKKQAGGDSPKARKKGKSSENTKVSTTKASKAKKVVLKAKEGGKGKPKKSCKKA